MDGNRLWAQLQVESSSWVRFSHSWGWHFICVVDPPSAWGGAGSSSTRSRVGESKDEVVLSEIPPVVLGSSCEETLDFWGSWTWGWWYSSSVGCQSGSSGVKTSRSRVDNGSSQSERHSGCSCSVQSSTNRLVSRSSENFSGGSVERSGQHSL